jgi:peptide deformylase
MPKLLKLRRLGDPVLREVAQPLAVGEIQSATIQSLIANIRRTNKIRESGVGLAAPQVGHSVALSVIGIKPTPNRPNLEPFEIVIINPEYEGRGPRTSMWEGCQSTGSGDNTLFGKALRYKQILARWYDERAQYHEEELSGFVAHVFQHETDHLNGILLVDKVRDARTFMLANEYRKRIISGKYNK